MAIGSYSALQADIATWMIRSDMAALAPKFIALAEDRFNKVIRRPEMEKVVTATTSDGTITLPSDFMQARSFYLGTEPRIALEQMGTAQLASAYYNQFPGVPAYYALQSGNQLVFGPAPDQDYDIVLNYYTKIPALSDSNTTNWLLDAHSDIYLAASLAEGFAFTLDAERGAYWEGKAVQKLEDLRVEGIKKAYSASPLTMRPSMALTGRISAY